MDDSCCNFAGAALVLQLLGTLTLTIFQFINLLVACVTGYFRFNLLGQLCSLSHVANYYDPSDEENAKISPARDFSMDGQMMLIALIVQAVTWPVLTIIACLSCKLCKERM